MPIDYVAGTSMGSIIGGLYATGMSADQLEATIRALNWSDIFADNTIRAERPFRRKRDDDLALFGPKFGVGAEIFVAAARRDQRSEDPVLPSDRDERARADEELRRAADSVPRNRRRHRHRQVGRHLAGRPRDRDAREHVDPGPVLADRLRGPPARRRRHRQQSAGQRRAGHGRRHRDRSRRRYAVVDAQRTDRLRFDYQSVERHHGRQQHRDSEIVVDAGGRVDRARSRQHDHVRRLHQIRSIDTTRLRGRECAARQIGAVSAHERRVRRLSGATWRDARRADPSFSSCI